MQIEKKQTAHRSLIALVVTAIALSCAACNTVRGIGDDLNSAADAVDEEI